jgi:outer membrane protein OmpA-like peptidoglycan-associated protein
MANANKLYSLSPGTLPSPTVYIASRDKKRTIIVNLKDSRNNPLSGTVELFQNNQSKKVTVRNGQAEIEVEKDKDYSIIASVPKYFVKSIEKPAKDTRKNIDFTLDLIKKKSTYIFDNINFKYNSAELDKKSNPTMKAITKLFKENPTLNIKIGGHTDNVGSDQFNMELSKKRAAKVKEYLTKNGIVDTRVTTQGYGETKPVKSNDTEENRKKNRRVEFTIY